MAEVSARLGVSSHSYKSIGIPHTDVESLGIILRIIENLSSHSDNLTSQACDYSSAKTN